MLGHGTQALSGGSKVSAGALEDGRPGAVHSVALLAQVVHAGCAPLRAAHGTSRVKSCEAQGAPQSPWAPAVLGHSTCSPAWGPCRTVLLAGIFPL